MENNVKIRGNRARLVEVEVEETTERGLSDPRVCAIFRRAKSRQKVAKKGNLDLEPGGNLTS